MSPITTHVLDTAAGRPAAGVPIALSVRDGDTWRPIGRGETDADGRCKTLVPAEHQLAAGDYRIAFDTAAYFRAAGQTGFYPRVEIEFSVTDPGQHYHVPLLLSPYGYSTYRGS